jgi:hypothetical protein
MDEFFDRIINYERNGLTDQMFRLIGMSYVIRHTAHATYYTYYTYYTNYTYCTYCTYYTQRTYVSGYGLS